ncbi:MAG: hypothetical protein KJ718_04975 [Nanoarchaeota archaeon]|nr:hypothetical protein [Nanoarchaeota archaeon]MBU1051878.1 hypothetical protein [Nanoarchaeota archaeon]MBU1988009.1 hypothetical protein [Nanoarchaeota archaeon]
MTRPISIKRAIDAAILSAFSIATALIWKDVVIDIIEMVAPPKEALIYKIIVATVATVLLIIVLYIILKTESEAEFVMKKLKSGNVKFVKAPSKPQASQIQKSK